MAKRSTRRMRGGFLNGIKKLFGFGELTTTPSNSTQVSSPRPPTDIVVVNNKGIGEKVVPGATAPLNVTQKGIPTAFGGARRRRRSTRRKARTVRRKASRKARRSASRKSRRYSRKH